MKKFRVFGVMSASVVLGEYEAATAEEAQGLADQDRGANWHPTICHHCSHEIDLGEIYETQVDEIED